MCTLSLNAERILVKLTYGVTTGCHLTWRTTPKSLPLQLWAFERLSVRRCALSSRNNHADEHLVFMMLKMYPFCKLILLPHTEHVSLIS